MVDDLRHQLRTLGLSTKGSRPDLAERLQSYQTSVQHNMGRYSLSQTPRWQHAAAHQQQHALVGLVAAQPNVGAKRERQSSELDVVLGIPAATAEVENSSSSMLFSPGAKKHRNVADNKKSQLEAAFVYYRDAGGKESMSSDQIGPEGVVLFCTDLGVDPEDPVMIAMSFVMGAASLGYFSRAEFLHGMQALGCATAREIVRRGKLEELRALLHDTHKPEFFRLYTFTYGWACEPNQKSIVKETALSLWPLLLGRMQFTPLQRFVQFVADSDTHGVSKDLWVQFFNFIRQCQANGGSFADHDSERGAWPVMIDEFVDSLKTSNNDETMFDS